MNQIIDIIEYLHSFNVYHGDIKPGNVLLDFNNKIKIIDFGTSLIFKDDDEN
jgi:serine/threonine protein kinase